MKKVLTLLVLGALIFAPLAQAEAQDPASKLGRGAINVVTGWVELPKNIYDTSVEESIPVGITVGLVKGFGMAVVRTGAGFYEVVTFPFDIPEGYIPILEPEFVFSNEEYVYEEENVAVIEEVEVVNE